MTSPAGGRKGKRQAFEQIRFCSARSLAGIRAAGSRPKNVGEIDENLGMLDGAIRAESSNLITVKYINLPRRHLSVPSLPMAKLSPDK